MSVRIELLVEPGCPNAGPTEELLHEVAGRLAPGAEIARTVVEDAEEAVRLGFPGSPTVRIAGEDLEGPDTGPGAMACRRYEGGAGVPPRWLVEARLLRALAPRHLLFLCVANSARSQMAEGIARSLAPDGMRISSAGSAPGGVNPLAVRVLGEIGIDASGHRSKGIEDVAAAVERGEAPPVDAVVTLCAEEVCPVWLGGAARAHWPHPDPAGRADPEEGLAAFRAVRDELRRKLGFLLAPAPGAGDAGPGGAGGAADGEEA
ncbi:MAG: arsenate reductase ArsC [Gemmatimonadota bacterium]|nr:arsenate reductase ArsC [Gemmatimonadota bacterium]